MAAATKILARSRTCVVVLNYDDVTLLASGVTIANVGGTEPVTFFLVLNGQTLTATAAIGQTVNIPFPSAAACTAGTAPNGLPNFVVSGLTSYGIGSATAQSAKVAI